jgi:hypothetical protein
VVAKPRLIATAGSDRVVVDDTSGGDRFVRLIRTSGDGTVTASVKLDAPDAVRDLRALQDGRILVVQRDTISLLTADLGKPAGTYTSKGTILSDR